MEHEGARAALPAECREAGHLTPQRIILLVDPSLRLGEIVCLNDPDSPT